MERSESMRDIVRSISTLIAVAMLVGCTASEERQGETTTAAETPAPLSAATEQLIETMQVRQRLDGETDVAALVAEGADVNARFQYTMGSLAQGETYFQEFTPLALAAYRKWPRTMQDLIDAGAEVNAQVDQTGDTPLTLLIVDSEGIEELVDRGVEVLLDAGADPNIARFGDGRTELADGATPLLIAIAFGYGEVVEALLTADADPNIALADNGQTVNSSGSTPLIVAMTGDIENQQITMLLLEYGADPNVSLADDGRTPFSNGTYPLHESVTRSFVNSTNLLLRYGAEPNVYRAGNLQVDGSNGDTPLHGAPTAELASLLLEFHADANARRRDNTDITPIEAAAYDGNTPVVRVLLDAGADPNLVSQFGTALDAAIDGGHPDTADLLRANGARTAEELGVTIN